MATCTSCGETLPEDARFCAQCGLAVEDETAIIESDQVPWECEQCGRENLGKSRFCASCGAPAADRCPSCGQMLGRSDAFCPACGKSRAGRKPAKTARSAAESERRRRRVVVGGAGAAILAGAIAAGVLAMVALFGGSHESFADRARKILGNVYPRQQAVTAQMQSLGKAKSLNPLKVTAKRLSTASLRAQDQIASLSTAAKPEQDEKASLLRALRSQARYANDLVALPSLPKLSLAPALEVGNQAQEARASYRPLATSVGQIVGRVSPPEPVQLLRRAREEQGRRQREQAKAIKLRAFVVKIEGFLTQSANGRQEIVSAIADTQNCSISPEESANRVDSVIRNRQSILDQLSALNPPNVARADHITSLLESGVEHSIEADRHYRDWMNYVFDYYYTPPQGCFGSPPENADFKAGQSESATATDYKSQFVRAFNPLAKKFHQRQWSEPEF